MWTSLRWARRTASVAVGGVLLMVVGPCEVGPVSVRPGRWPQAGRPLHSPRAPQRRGSTGLSGRFLEDTISMPKVTFVNEKVELEVPAGANLRQEAMKAGIDVYGGLKRYLN